MDKDQTTCPVCQQGGYPYVDTQGIYFRHPGRQTKCRIDPELSVAWLKANEALNSGS